MTAAPSRSSYDVLIIGGGPSGATAAMLLARAGFQVLVIEKNRFPRFHVGESFLPINLALIRQFGLADRLAALPHVQKLGAEFAFGDATETTRIRFSDCLDDACPETFNIERAPFDDMLLRAAEDAGAEVVEDVAVRGVERLADGDVALDVGGQSVSGKYLLDASGQATLLGKHLGTRRAFPHHRKVAYFAHFENVKRLEGDEAGHPLIVMCDEGWFWAIPIDPRRTSIGLVLDADVARTIDEPAQQRLAWGIARCPLLRERTADAVFPDSNHVVADFSYTCAPYAGPGYFLVGDAGVFYDPVFSSGAGLSMMGAIEAANGVAAILGGTKSADAVRRSYCRFVDSGSSRFFRLINQFYQHSFRELLLTGRGPLQMHRALISLLAGHIFPKPSFPVRWRYRLFGGIVRLQRHIRLAPRQAPFSLLKERPVERASQQTSQAGASSHAGKATTPVC